MKNIKLVSLVLLNMLLIPFSSFSMDIVGNGGDVILCRDSVTQEIKLIELLDFYEGTILYEIKKYDLGDASLSFLDKVEHVLLSIYQNDPNRVHRYREGAQKFLENSKFLSGIELIDIPDSYHTVIPKGCKIEQIVIQKEPIFPQDKLFAVNNDLWEALNDGQKAGLILHEVIFNEALEVGHEHSIFTRYFNAFLCSGQLRTLSLEHYKNFLGLVRLPYDDTIDSELSN